MSTASTSFFSCFPRPSSSANVDTFHQTSNFKLEHHFRPSSSEMSTFPCVIGPPEGSPHTHTVIFLHGRDSNAVEFASEFFESEASGPEADRTMTSLFPTIRWVFPQATTLRSARFNSDMSQWFDMWSLDNVQERSGMQVAGLRLSVETVLQIIKDEERIVPRDRIFLAGISQGFATCVTIPSQFFAIS